MKPAHLIMSKHQDRNSPAIVRGEKFSSDEFSSILALAPVSKVGLLLEDNFIGSDFVLKGDRVRHDNGLRSALSAQTRDYREFASRMARAVGAGSGEALGVLSPEGITGLAIEENRASGGRIRVGLSATCEEAQLLTIESFFWKNQGYLAAFKHGDADGGAECLVKSIGLMAAAVRIRDSLVISQASAFSDSVDLLILLQGSNHRNLLSEHWPGLAVRPHIPDSDPLTFYDEALVRLLGPSPPGSATLSEFMRREIMFHSLFFPLVHSGADMYVEDMIDICRISVERMFSPLPQASS